MNPNNTTERLSVPPLDNVINNKIEFVKLIIQIRNKIAHCDTSGLYKKLHKYKNEYMKHYYFDYYEYSEENWIYLNLSCRLNAILADILYSKIINNKSWILFLTYIKINKFKCEKNVTK